MKKKIIISSVVLLTLSGMGYFHYTYVKDVDQVLTTHDAVLLKIICDNKLPGFIDLEVNCPKQP